MQTVAQEKAARDFGKQTVKKLAKLGIAFIGATWIRGLDGDFANGETGYVLDNNGQTQVRTWLQVSAMAEGKAN